MNIFSRLCAGLLAAVLAIPLAAHAADSWAKSRKLTLDTTASGANIDAAVNQLPLLVRLHSGNFVFSQAKPDGSDLRFFAADNKTALKYHIERYDAANELGLVWVQLPALIPNSKANTVWVHWGNPAAAAAGDSKSTYDATQVLVLNLSEPDGFKDASANGNHPSESTATAVTFGPIGGAASFNGAARIVLPASESLKLLRSEGWTFTAWIKPATAGKGSLLALGSGASALSIDLANNLVVLGQAGKSARSTAALKPGVWQQLAVTFSAGKVQFYINGAAAGEAALALDDASGAATLGVGFSGELDNLTLARTARSPAYLKAVFASQSADSPMIAFSDEAEEEKGVSYFAILLGAVTLDGWVVIGILGLMALISLYVMVTKTLQLSRAEKSNAIFLEIFKNASVALLHPDDKVVRELELNKSIQPSSIYQLYRVGLHEIAQRFEAQRQAQAVQRLTSAALESIRASLDATIVRAAQRFNAGMVLLTIAISGGPFLGLLGTVVGVMITFAAIAAAGDVNVNAIAPGIAAALVATVAGLAVAIPALFAYNWFAVKIKNISADTQVFADEFLTKSAELYSD
jgi:biopolymer transport protein ExbB